MLNAGSAARVVTTSRVYMLLFSLPYVWLWTEGLPSLDRWSAVGAHGLAILAVAMWNDALDAEQGLPPHLGLTRAPEGRNVDLARSLSWPLAGAAVAASLGLLDVSVWLPIAVVAVLCGAWLGVRLPAGRKYLGWPEITAPLMTIVAPAAMLTAVADATAGVSTTVAGAAFLAALVVASHIRDRDTDLRHRVPTLATRNLHAARGWLLMAALIGAVAACASLTIPLNAVEAVRAFGALAFGVLASIRPGRVPLLFIAHGIFALSLLL